MVKNQSQYNVFMVENQTCFPPFMVENQTCFPLLTLKHPCEYFVDATHVYKQTENQFLIKAYNAQCHHNTEKITIKYTENLAGLCYLHQIIHKKR